MNPIRRRRLGGISYPNIAAQFVTASTQSLSIADNATLSMPSTSFTLACWVYFDSVAASQCMIGKLSAGPNLGYMLNIESNAGPLQFQFFLSTTGSNLNRRFATTLGTPVAGAWYFVVAWLDIVAQTMNIQVNNGTVDSTASFTGTCIDDPNPFRLGANDFGGAQGFMGGRLDSVGVWKQALSASDRAALYKGGVGMAYRDLSGSLLTSLSGWWNLDGNGNDASGNANNLTNNNNVTFVAGKR